MKYILEYQIPIKNNEGRYYALSACEKANYIINKINELGVDVEIISPSYAKKTSKSRVDRINNQTVLISGFSFGWSGSLSRCISRLSSMVWLLYFLLFKCKKSETLLIYHGVQNIPIFILAKWVKKFTYILEVEEIYSSLNSLSKYNWRFLLERYMICISNKYIFASKQLEYAYNKNRKPYLICTGNYMVPPILTDKFNDGKIHLVYAGLIEKNKVAFRSANVANYLNEKYVLHIIGYGKENDIDDLCILIDEINQKAKCKVVYEGLKRGTDYNLFLQRCHIGLCPLSNEKNFQYACFPSKISSYLSNGLLVVTTENDVLRECDYKDFLFFAQDMTPMNFALTIKRIDISKNIDPRACVISEDRRFSEEFVKFI